MVQWVRVLVLQPEGPVFEFSAPMLKKKKKKNQKYLKKKKQKKKQKKKKKPANIQKTITQALGLEAVPR